MSCNCETGKFPIKIIQGDSYRRVYKFYDVDGNIIDNINLATVYFTCARLNYSTSLNYSTDDEGWVLYFTSDTTKEFAYCKSDYDLTLYFTDRQISTQIYRSEFRVCEKKIFPVVEVSGEGEYVNVDDITTEVYTNIIVGNGGGIADHSILFNRGLPNQHPMSAITGLEDALNGKQPIGDYATTQELDELANIVDGKADSGDIPTKTSDLTNDSDFTTTTYVDDADTVLQGQIDDLQAEKMPLTEIDAVPTDGSSNLVESGGVYDAIDAVQQDVDDIEAVISTQATPTNKLVSASEMGDAISSVEAKQLYATASQGSFATKSQLLSTTTFYNADGTVATPTKNDIAYVLADESHSGKSAKYVIADITSSGIVWGFVITFSDTTFSQTQMDAINSGVTQQKVSAYDSHIANKSNPHEVTYQQLGGTNPSYTKGETDTLLGGKLSDAPSDGKQYARKDGAWSEVVSGSSSAIIIPYSSLGVTPYTFAEVTALLDSGNEVKVQTGSYIPHCTSYSNSIITFFDITSWDLSAGVYTITYVHLRDTNDKYTYSETEPLNPVVYARIAPNYSDSADYAVGDYCTRYENVYRCTTSVLGGEEWNSAHWTVVTVMGEVVNKQDKLIAGTNITIAADGKTISATGGGGADLPETTALLKGDGNGGALAAEAGTDYFAPDEDGNIVLEDAGVELKTNAKGVKLTGANPDGTPFLTIEDVNNPDEPVVITGVAEPVMRTQAVNKGYVDDNFALKSDLDDYQPKTIADSAGYYTTDTVEGALAEIGAELAGINTLIGSGVIT